MVATIFFDKCMLITTTEDNIGTSSSKKTLRILAIFLLGKCWVLHIYLKNT